MKKVLFIALSLGFLFFGFSAYTHSRPTEKNKRVYHLIKAYSPYYLDKRFGGLTILSKNDKEFKEKPSNMDVFRRFEELEKKWASTNLELDKNSLFIKNSNNNVVTKILLDTPDEIKFVHNYYGI